MITDEELAELSRLIVSNPTARVIAKAVKACKPPRPAPKPAPVPRDPHHARLKGAVTHAANKVRALDEALAAIEAAKGTKREWAVRFDALSALSGEWTVRPELKRAQEALAAYETKLAAAP